MQTKEIEYELTNKAYITPTVPFLGVPALPSTVDKPITNLLLLHFLGIQKETTPCTCMFHFVHRPTTVYRPMGGYLISFIPKFHSKISFIIDLIHL